MFNRGFLFFLMFTLFAGVSHAAEWVVERTTKNVSMSIDGKSWQPVTIGKAIPNAYWVRTGARARVMLVKGSERIIYRENTLAAVSISQPKGTKTKVTQQQGSILLSVRRQRAQHTSVVTPHLAAVVKGTVFEVTVGKTASNVRVDKGLVEVSTGRETVDIPAGRQAAAKKGASGFEVSNATKTSLQKNGSLKLDLTEIKQNNSLGGNGNSGGNSNSGGNGNGNSGGGGNSGGNGKSSN